MNAMRFFLFSACASLAFGVCAFAQLSGLGSPIIHADGPSLLLDNVAIQKELKLSLEQITMLKYLAATLKQVAATMRTDGDDNRLDDLMIPKGLKLTAEETASLKEMNKKIAEHMRKDDMPDEVAVKKLSAVQLALIQKLAEKLKAPAITLDKKTARDKLRAINAEGTKAAALVLDPAQLRRLEQLQLQIAGPSVFVKPDIAEQIGLTLEQRQIAKDAYNEGRMQLGKEAIKLPAGAGLAKMKESNQVAMSKIMAILTDTQKDKYAKLVGERFSGTLPFVWSPPISEDEVKVSATATKPDKEGKQTLIVTLVHNNGWHTYANLTGNKNTDNAPTEIMVAVKGKKVEAKINYPAGKLLGDQNIYENKVSVRADIQRDPGDSSPLEVSVRFQACHEKGVCQSPKTVKLIVP